MSTMNMTFVFTAAMTMTLMVTGCASGHGGKNSTAVSPGMNAKGEVVNSAEVESGGGL